MRAEVVAAIFFAAALASSETHAAATLVKDIHPSGDSNISGLVDVNGTLFFSADDGTHGAELWKSDGSDAGTVLVRDINLGAAGAAPAELVNRNGMLFFFADDGNGRALWTSDGTDVGTLPVVKLPGAHLANVNGTLFFIANSALWKSDGTAEGTVVVFSFAASHASAASRPIIVFGPSDLVGVNGTLFFTNASQIWKSDGTGAGTVVVASPNTSYLTGGSIYVLLTPANLQDINGTLFFSADSGGGVGREVWKSDGTEAGTVLVKDIYPGVRPDYSYGGPPYPNNSNPSFLVDINGKAVFAATDATSGTELWQSNGTDAGTVLLHDINPGSASSAPQFPAQVDAQGRFYFGANDGTNGMELWQSDGTPAGASILQDIAPGSAGSNPQLLTRCGTKLFFAANDGIHGDELWVIPLPDSAPIFPKSMTFNVPRGETVNIHIPLKFGASASFVASDLPEGLTLSGGVLSGKLKTNGDYSIHLQASNSLGVDNGVLLLSVMNPEPKLNALKSLRISLNFATQNQDSLSLNGTLALPQDFSLAGKHVTIDIGGFVRDFDLDAKGAAVSGNDVAKLSARRNAKLNLLLGKFSAKFAHGSFAASLNDEGLTGATSIKNEPRFILVNLTLGNSTVGTAAFGAQQKVLYSAKAGVSGTARQHK